jgi:eukaryotic-like serine/threonine-protein kinase
MSETPRWLELERLYHAALEREPEERASFVEQACAHDEDLRRELESLLEHDRPEDDFLDPLQPGSLVGSYRIVERIGRGGMGMIYRAEQQFPVRRQVALKIIKPGMDSEQVIARFQAERQALALMDHPNIARVFDAGSTSSGRLYFVMELVDGLPVTEYCEKLQLGLRERLALFVPICNAIQHAHQKGVIHRDIKPSNVLVTVYDGQPAPKVIDFGIAKAMQEPLTERSMHTQVGAVIGTLEYMSPEQAGSFGEDIDTRSDVYALGAVLYELITGSTPLHRDSLEHSSEIDVIRRIREENPPVPSARLGDSKLIRSVSGDLDWVVMKALEKDRVRRYTSVSALGDDIENYLNGAPVAAGPPSTAYRLKKMAQRHRSLVGTVAVVAVLLIGGAAVSMREAIRARRAVQSSAAVSAFLQNDLLAQASANLQASSSLGRPDPDLKVRTALDRAAEQIGGRFTGQPLVEASIRHTIGATYLDLGLFDEARRQLERAIELRRQMVGERDPLTLESQNLLVSVYIGQGKPSEAEPLGRYVLVMRRKLLGERHPDTLTSLHNMAAIERLFARDAQAKALYAQVAELRRQVLGPNHPDTLKSLSNLGYVSMLLEKYPQAVEIHTRVLEIRRRVLGEEHPDTMQSRYALALALMNNNQADKAEELLRKVLEWRRRVLGPSHVDTLNVMNALGMVSEVQGKYSQGENLFAECLVLASKTLGDQHPTAAACRENIASLFEDEGKYELSVREFRKMLGQERRHLGDEHPDTLRTMSNLAIALGLAGHYTKSRDLFNEVIALRKRILGPKNPKTLSSMNELANLEKRQGRYAESEKLFREVVALRRDVLGPKHPNTLSSVTSLADVNLEQGKYREAEPLLREALDAAAGNSWSHAVLQILLGWCLTAQKQFAEAGRLLQAGYLELRQNQDRQPAADRLDLERARRRLLVLRQSQAISRPSANSGGDR